MGAVLSQVEALSHELLSGFDAQRIAMQQSLQTERMSMQGDIQALRDDFLTAGREMRADFAIVEQALGQVTARQARQQSELDALLARLDAPAGWRRLRGKLIAFLRHRRRNLSAFFDLWRVRRFAAQALGDVEPSSGQGAGAWRSTGDDPRFLLMPKGPGLPSSGWYSLTTRIDLVDTTALIEPSLYVDYGNGMGEAGKIILRFDPQQSAQRVLVKFEGDVRSLRFDPSTQPCAFSLGDVRLRKLSAIEAALRLAAPTLAQLRRSPRHLSMTSTPAGSP